jgi:hypothetical protein
MTPTAVPVKPVETPKAVTTPAEVQKLSAENHRKAAKHHEAAAKHYEAAAKHVEAGNIEKASDAAMKAQGHACIATEAHLETAKQCALKN